MLHLKGETVLYPLPKEERIQRYERYWGVRFPDDYREFLKTYNGAEPVEKSFEAIGHLFALTRFFCALEDYKDRDVGWYDLMVMDMQIGEFLQRDPDSPSVELAPIGEVFGECFLCLDYRQDPEHPGVCILDKENSGEYDPTTYPVANSFTEFLGMLHITEGEMLRFGDDLRKELADPRVIEVPTGEGDRQELAERAARREEPAPQKHRWKWPWQK